MQQRSDNRSSSRITPTRSGTSVSPRSRTGMSTRSKSKLPRWRGAGFTPKPSADDKYTIAPPTVITAVDKPKYVTSNEIKDTKGNTGSDENEDLTNPVSHGPMKVKLPKLNQRDFPFPVKCVIHRRIRPADVMKISTPEQCQVPDPLELQRIVNEFEMYKYRDQIAYLDGLIGEGEELIRQSKQTEAVLSQQYAFLDDMDMYEDKLKECRIGQSFMEAAVPTESSKPNVVTANIVCTGEANISHTDDKVNYRDANFDTKTLRGTNVIAGNAFDVKFCGQDSGIDLNMSEEKIESIKTITGMNTIKLSTLDIGTKMYEPLSVENNESMESVTRWINSIKIPSRDIGTQMYEPMSVENIGNLQNVSHWINSIKLPTRDMGTQMYEPLYVENNESINNFTHWINSIKLPTRDIGTQMYEPLSMDNNESIEKFTRLINSIKIPNRDIGTQMCEPLSVGKNESIEKVTCGINTTILQIQDTGTQMSEPLLDTVHNSMLSKVTFESKCMQTDFVVIKTMLTHLKSYTEREDGESKPDTERKIEQLASTKERHNEEEVIECERSALNGLDSKLNEETSNEDKETSEKMFDNDDVKEYIHGETKFDISCAPTTLPASQSFRLPDQLKPPDIPKTGVQSANRPCTDDERLNLSKIISAMRSVTRVHEKKLNEVKYTRKLSKLAHRLKKDMEIAMLKEEFAKYCDTSTDLKDTKETNVYRRSANRGDAKDIQHNTENEIRTSNKKMTIKNHEFGKKSDKNSEENNKIKTDTQSKANTKRKSAKRGDDNLKQNAKSKVDTERVSSQCYPDADRKLVRPRAASNRKVDTGRNAAQSKMDIGRNVVRLPKLDTKSNSNRRQPSVQSRVESVRNIDTGRKQGAASKKNNTFDNSCAKPKPTVPDKNVVGKYKLPPINDNCKDVFDSKEKYSKSSTMAVEKRKSEAMFISFSPSPPVGTMSNRSVHKRPTTKEANVAQREAGLKAKRSSHCKEDAFCHGNLKENAKNTCKMNIFTSGQEKECATGEVHGNKTVTENDGQLGHARQKLKAEALWVSFSPSPPIGRGLISGTKHRPLKPGNNNKIDNQKAQWSENFYKTIDGLNPTQRSERILNDMNETLTQYDTAPIQPERKNAEALWVSFSPTPPRGPPPRRRRIKR